MKISSRHILRSFEHQDLIVGSRSLSSTVNSTFRAHSCLAQFGHQYILQPSRQKPFSILKSYFSLSSVSRGYIPELMEFPHLYLPKITNTFRNGLLSRTLIRPYFDKDFSVKEFVKGAKECLISTFILDPLQTPIEKRKNLFSISERSELNLTEDDIYYSFLYQIGIMMDDDPDENGAYGRSVECSWVGHAFKNYLQIVDEERTPTQIKEILDKERGPTILNFRFVRNYSKGVEDSWTVNALNYYKLKDL